MNDVGLILKASEFAAARHRTQLRKGADKSPYINHPIQVANLLINDAGEKDPVLLAAAILHDVVEDTAETPEEKKVLIDLMIAIFGAEVLSIVLEVTDDKSLEKPERKRLQIVHAPHLTDNAKKLKIADKIMNVKDITNHPPTWWTLERILEYFEWSEKVVAGLRGVNNKLEDMFDKVLEIGRKKYEENPV
jgi:GTP diphosphokinase / guanosine-3',5'-bis(diphosphate) 3'-diphosphatase